MPQTGAYRAVIRNQAVPAVGTTITNPLGRVPSHIHIEQHSGDGRVTIDPALVTATQIPLANAGNTEATVELYLQYWWSPTR
jgi:hypothetical protein